MSSTQITDEDIKNTITILMFSYATLASKTIEHVLKSIEDLGVKGLSIPLQDIITEDSSRNNLLQYNNAEHLRDAVNNGKTATCLHHLVYDYANGKWHHIGENSDKLQVIKALVGTLYAPISNDPNSEEAKLAKKILNTKDCDDATVLVVAASDENKKLVEYFAANGVDIDKSTINHIAITSNTYPLQVIADTLVQQNQKLQEEVDNLRNATPSFTVQIGNQNTKGASGSGWTQNP